YGQKYLIASARVWWSFRPFGHHQVAALAGGFPKGQAEGRPVESGPATPHPRRFAARLRPELVRDLGRIRANVDTRREQVVDARSHGRFVGTEPEPRGGMRSGHIPGSVCLPYDRLFRPEDGTLLPAAALREVFGKAGVEAGRPIRNPAALPAEYRTRGPGGGRGRYMLHRTPRFNITAVVWAPGDVAAAHNHDTWGVIGVIENRIEETRYRVTPDTPGHARLEVMRVMRHEPGAISRLVPGDEVHRMHNPTSHDTVEIHVY